jgi:NTE family protein
VRPRGEPHARRPTVAVALGGGGARGLAHIVVLETLDELGLEPVAIAGTSIGAILGAAYAAGLPGRRLRSHVNSLFRRRTDVLVRLFEARVGRMSDLVQRWGNPVMVDGEKLLDRFWPDEVPDRFEDLAIPFVAVATDYYARSAVAFDRGPLVTAVAASMAVPGLVKPIETGGRVLIDGGAVNPLPFDLLAGAADIVVAVDVTGGPLDEGDAPEGFSATFGAAQIMQGAIVAEKLKARAPDILLRPKVEHFRVLDFFRSAEILKAAAPLREELADALRPLVGGGDWPALSAPRDEEGA